MAIAAVIGKDGRTSAICERLQISSGIDNVVTLSDGKAVGSESDRRKARTELLELARRIQPEFVVIGPEEPLADGIVDELSAIGISCVGPTSVLAQLESSKSFTRRLVAKHGIPGNPEFRIFSDLVGLEEYLEKLQEFVVKPDGLTGGKGVKVSDVHLHSISEALQYCREIFTQRQGPVIIEEKLDGEEFSLQSFSDGMCVKHMPVVQDHKRVGVGDAGPNTGGMGSYSCPDHSLPFLPPEQLEQAKRINEAVGRALLAETGQPYKGILYGGFMATSNGVRLIEYNARFGDPEALNVLSILETDFAEICRALVRGTLSDLSVRFSRLATVCKYVVPKGYPENAIKGEIDLSQVPAKSPRLRIFEAAVATDPKTNRKYLTGSRAIAFVGIGTKLAEAEQIAEAAACAVAGPVYHRNDIGTHDLLARRIAHMRNTMLRSASYSMTI